MYSLLFVLKKIVNLKLEHLLICLLRYLFSIRNVIVSSISHNLGLLYSGTEVMNSITSIVVRATENISVPYNL